MTSFKVELEEGNKSERNGGNPRKITALSKVSVCWLYILRGLYHKGNTGQRGYVMAPPHIAGEYGS